MADSGSPGAFITEVSEEKQPSSSNQSTPVRARRVHHTDPSTSSTGDAAFAGYISVDSLVAAVSSAVSGALRSELSRAVPQPPPAAVPAPTSAVNEQQQSLHAAQQLQLKCNLLECTIAELEEDLGRKRLSHKELNYRGHFALLATADRAHLANRGLRHGIQGRDQLIQQLQQHLHDSKARREQELQTSATKAGLAGARIDALEDALSAAERLIEELQAELREFRGDRRGGSNNSNNSYEKEAAAAAAGDDNSGGSATSTENAATASSVTNEEEQDEVASLSEPSQAAGHPELVDATPSAVMQLLATRLREARADVAAATDETDLQAQRAEEAELALRMASEVIEAMEARIAALEQEQQRCAANPPPPAATVSFTPAEAAKLASLGGLSGLLSTLSERTQLLAEYDDENKRLREEITLLEARCVTTETRLHHSVEEGVATSILLERGIGRIKAHAVAEPEGAETRKTLTQAALTLRRALEREGYDITTLPLTPDPTLDLPYLRQILSDHAELCAAHFHRGAGGHVVPSATRTPMIYGSR